MNRRRKPNFVVVHGDRELPKEEGNALLLDLSVRLAARQEQCRQARRIARLSGPNERVSVQRLMLAIEDRFVRGLWVLELALAAEGADAYTVRNGLGYVHDHDDPHARYTDAAAGKWNSVAPRPAVPSNKEIDAANEAKEWVRFLPPFHARILSIGALTKRGDAGRKVNWERVRERLPEARGYSLRGLRNIYSSSLRTIAGELTLSELAK